MASYSHFAVKYQLLFNDYISFDFSSNNAASLFYDLKSFYKELILTITAENPQFFPSLYSRIIFIANHFKLNEIDRKKLLFLQKILSQKEKVANFSRQDYAFVLKLFNDVLKLFSHGNIEPMIIADWYSKSNLFLQFSNYTSIPTGTDSFYRIIITGVDPFASTIVCADGNREFKIICRKWWNEIPKIVNPGITLNVLNLQQTNEAIFETTSESIIVVEPDYLFDVTEIASAYSKNGFNAYVYLVNKLFNSSFSFYTFIGNIVNATLDELLFDKNKPLKEIIESTIGKRILEFLVLKDRNPNIVNEIYSTASKHYSTIVELLPFFQQFDIQVEPSFFSAEFGLQGRLDLLLEDKKQKNVKYIVELKSGSFPENPVEFRVGNNISYFTPLWHSHYAQTIGYNLLADSAWETRRGSSMIFYSQDKSKPLREAVNNNLAKREFIRSRNWAFFFENSIANRRFRVLDTIISKLRVESSNYNDALNQFKVSFSNLSPKYRKLLYYFLSFVYKEAKLAKVYDSDIFDTRYSQHHLWILSKEEKMRNLLLLNDLVLLPEKSNFEAFYLTFCKTEKTTPISSLRRGDAIVLYHPSFFENDFSGQVFKGVIKSIDNREITISLRNKQTRRKFFEQIDGWIIEPDVIDSTFRNLLNSLMKFSYLNEEKIDYLLAERFPDKAVINCPSFAELDEPYQRILSEAVAYHPFYIIKGPPGTGKTRIVIKNLVEYYFRNTSVNILVLSYTNRAVDEVAEVLIKNGLGDDFIRIGTKESSEFTENVIGFIVERYSIDQVESKIKKCRIFLSTVFSALTNQSLFYLKKFQIAIIDEASQILFPHLIGILVEIDKFILIGDEKQLPAIVLQENSSVNDSDILELGFGDLRISYFEFLIRKLTAKGVKECISLLNTQTRMHPSILDLVNYLFYEGKIQTASRMNNDSMVEKAIERFLRKIDFDPSFRVIFVDCPLESFKKINPTQAEIISLMIDFFVAEMGDCFTSESIGVVTPYRLQNAEIYSRINSKVRELVAIDTVERFQGSERNIIFLSLPFNSPAQIRFSQSIYYTESGHPVDRKLNVAISRAKDLLVILGNKNLLLQNDIYRKSIEYLESKCRVLEYSVLISILDHRKK